MVGVTNITFMPTREVHRSEPTDLDENYQRGIFNNGDDIGKVQIRQIGTRKQEIS